MDRPLNSLHGLPAFLLAIAVCCPSAAITAEKPHERFHQADANHDENLDLTEFENTQKNVARHQIEQEFAVADRDHDEVLTLTEFERAMHPYRRWLWALGLFSLVSFVGSLVAIPFVVARLPVDHFTNPKHHAADWLTSSIGRRLWLVFKNLLGIILIAGGIVMLILPGQGVLTILLGVALLDIPGKWRLMRAIARRPEVMKALNWMRKKAHQAPMLPPDDREPIVSSTFD